MPTTPHIQSGIAVLADASDTFDDDAPWTVHGVAMPEGEVTVGKSGTPTYWPPGVLQEATGLLVGKSIVKNFHDDTLEQAPADDVIGQVTADGYADGIGLVFEGEITDREIAQKIAAGYLDVSPRVARTLGAFDEQREARVAESVDGFLDIAVVDVGAFQGNEIEMGPNPAVAALSQHVVDGIRQGIEALSVSRPEFNGYSEAQWDAPTLNGTYDGDMDAARNAATWVDGDGETFGDLSLFVLDGNADLNLNALDSAWRLAPQTDGPTDEDVTRLRSLYEGLAVQARDNGPMSDDEFEETWQDRVADDAEAAASVGVQDGSHPGSDDGPHGSTGQSDPGSTTEDTMSDLSDKEKELLRKADRFAEPTLVEAAEAKRLTEFDALLDAAAETDDPRVVSESEFEALQEDVDAVRDVLGAALQEHRNLTDATVEAMSIEAMAAEFRDDDDDLGIDAFTQDPETGGSPSDPDDPDAGPGSIEALAADQRSDVKDKLRRADLLEDRTPDHAESLRREAADIVGVDDPDDLDVEVA